MTFLLSEDKALREKLQGMIVHDQKAGLASTTRQVGVWFGQPDQEIRDQSYPYVTIDLVDIQRDSAREMRGFTSADYLKPEDAPTNKTFIVDLPIPVFLEYQITTYSRHPRHDREIIAQLLGHKLPLRAGALEVEDKTVRRLDTLSVNKRDVTEQARRLFVNAITIRVSSEILQNFVDDPESLTTYRYTVTDVNVHNPDPTREGGRSSVPDYYGTGNFTISAP